MRHQHDDTRVFNRTPGPGRGTVTPLTRDPHHATPSNGENRNGDAAVEGGAPPAVRSTARGDNAWDLAKDVLLTLSTFVGPLQAFFDEAVDTIAGTLDAPHAEILQLTPEGFARRARIGLGHAPPSHLLDSDPGGSHAGYAHSAERTLSVRNYGLESRFRVPDYLREAGISSGVTVPVLLPGGGSWGVIAVHDRPNRSFSADARTFAEQVARLVGVAAAREREVGNRCAGLDRELEEERTARRSSEWRLGYFAEAEQIAAVAETTADAVQAVVRHAVPALADWCYVDLIHEHAAGPVTIARDFLEHADDRPDSTEIADEFKTRYPFDYNAPLGTPKVLRTGQPELLEQITDEQHRLAAKDASRHRLLRRLGVVSSTCVPLEVGRRRVGAVGFYSTTSGRRFDADALEMACRLARILSLRLAGAAASPACPPEAPREAPSHREVLSPTELKILKELDKNKTPQQIAAERKKSLSTIRNQITGIRRSFGVNSYEEALDIARERGYITARPNRQ